jgi:hypothetical protein
MTVKAMMENQAPDEPMPTPPPVSDPDLVPGVKEPPPSDLPGEVPHPNPDEDRNPPKQS